jgi:hypothetical protein
MSDSVPTIDLDTEANQSSVQAVPGAVFVRLRRDRPDGTVRRMFVELSVGEAIAVRRELEACIRAAAAAAQP